MQGHRLVTGAQTRINLKRDGLRAAPTRAGLVEHG